MTVRSVDDGHLAVVVIDGNDIPVDGAVVMIVDSPTEHSDIAAVTGDDGVAGLGWFAPGSYGVSATSPDGRRSEQRVAVLACEHVVARIRMDSAR